MEPVAVARAIRSGTESDSAEAAFVTADDWQRHGVGSAVVQELARRSQAVGIRRWRAVYFMGNRGAKQLLAGVGKQVSAEPVGGGVVDTVWELKVATAVARAARGAYPRRVEQS